MQSSSPSPIRVVIAARTSVRDQLRDALAAAGIEVAATCGDVAELVAAIARERPDVCVLDRELRGGAFGATAAIATPRRTPRVLVVGGRGSPAERRAARLAGADDCLPSHIDAATVAAVVAMLARKEQP